MTNATITRPEWSTVIDPVLQRELEQHVLVTNWDKLLGIVDTVYNWGRRSALWPLGFGLACCAIEMICTASSRFDIARFGAEVFRGSPRQADLMIVSGTVTKTMMPMIARLYDQMPEPKYVIAMGACATGGGPFKEGYNVVSGVDKYIPVDVYIPGCPPTPQALLNGLIMLQKKIDGERLEIPVLGKHGFSPWYGNEVERDIPIPVLGPDLIDLRTVEIAAEKTAMGLLDQHESGLVKPAKIPAPQPEPEAETAPRPRRTGRRAEGHEQDRHDPRQGTGRGRADGCGPGPGAEPIPRRPPKGGKKVKRAEARPTLVWLGDAKLKELAERINTELGAGTVSIIQAGLAGQDRPLDRRGSLPPRQESDQVRLSRQPAERSLRRLHRGELPARQHRQARDGDRATGSKPPKPKARVKSRRSTMFTGGPTFRSARSTT